MTLKPRSSDECMLSRTRSSCKPSRNSSRRSVSIEESNRRNQIEAGEKGAKKSQTAICHSESARSRSTVR